VKQSRPQLRFLTEWELETAVRLAKRHGDVLAVTAGTGLRFGEISALWVGDVDHDGTVRVNKAWKRNGEDDATDTPGWLSRQLRAKHTMRDHHLGHPKTPRSRRTTIAPTVAALLEKRIEGRPADEFVFTSRTGLPFAQRRLLHPRLAQADMGVPQIMEAERSEPLDRQAWPRVDHHDDRHVRSPAARGRRVDLADHRYCAYRWHYPPVSTP
jgi:integrase